MRRPSGSAPPTRERDLQRVKTQSEAAIHAAEDKARRELNPDGTAPPKPEVWWEDAQSNAQAEGLFVRLDCLGQEARIYIQTGDGKTTPFLIRDPSKIVLVGGGEKALHCGVQRPARKVAVQYISKPDPKLKTAGEAQTIEFR